VNAPDAAALPILPVDHPMLRRKSSRLARVGDDTRRLIAAMFATMDRYGGIGLAANQIGRPWRVIVVGLDAERHALVNPAIARATGAAVAEEGCLSLPNWYGPVERATTITVKALDLRGQPVRHTFNGLLARAVQHEVDHLDGVIFTDRLTDPTALRFVDPREAAERGLHAS